MYTNFISKIYFSIFYYSLLLLLFCTFDTGLEEIRKRGSDAVEIALDESKTGSTVSSATNETIRLEGELRRSEDALRSKTDANDTLRRDLDNQDQKLRRMNSDFKESEIDRQKANSGKNYKTDCFSKKKREKLYIVVIDCNYRFRVNFFFIGDLIFFLIFF